MQDSSNNVTAALPQTNETSSSTRFPESDLPDRLAWLVNLLRDFRAIKVVDVGANPIEGDPSYSNLLGCGLAQVVGFEPNPEAHSELVKHASANETYYCKAIGSGGAKNLFLTQHSGFSSLFKPDQASAEYLGFVRPMKVARTEEIMTERLDDLDEIQPIDFLKIDIQGGELDVISSARNKLSEALVIQTEVRFFPLYENEPTFGDLENELRDQGFTFHSFDFLKKVLGKRSLRKKLRRRAFTQVVDGDAFFIRDPRRMQDFSNEQLSKLCILAESVIGAFDLSGLCLAELANRGEISKNAVETYVSLLPDRLLR